MGYGFKCGSDLTWYEKLGMLSLWLAFGGLLLWIPGVVLLILTGLQMTWGASETLTKLGLVVGTILIIPSSIGVLGYLTFGAVAQAAYGLRKVTNLLQVFRSGLQNGR